MHATACPLGDGFRVRHDEVCKTLNDVFQRLPGVSVLAQYADKTNDDLVVDFVLTHFPDMGTVTHFEVSVISHLQDRFLRSEPGTAGRTRDQEKARKYLESTRAAHAKFHSGSFEVSGRPSRGMNAVLGHIVRLHDRDQFELSGPSRTWACMRFKQYLYQRIAIAFWTGAAAMERTRTRINTAAAAHSLRA